MNIFCLSADQALGKQVCEEASRLRWNAVCVSDRTRMSQDVRQYDPDLLLIDISNFADLEWWRGADLAGKVPVIFLIHENSEEFMVRALDYGADSFLPKSPFSPRYFEARVRALLRRRGSGGERRFIASLNMVVDNGQNTVEINGAALTLTLTEFKILRMLASAESKVVPRLEIQTRVFGQAEAYNRSLDVHICSLREKVKPQGFSIESIRGVGYRVIGKVGA